MPNADMATDLAKRVAARHLRAQQMTGMEGAKALLAAVERAEGEVHGGIRSIRHFDDASREESKKYRAIEQKAKSLYQQLEDLRLDLDEWIIDYEGARRGKAPTGPEGPPAHVGERDELQHGRFEEEP